MNLNKAFILGNVTREPEIRSLPSGQQVAIFGVATNRFYTDASGEKKQDVEFHNVVCFGKLADISSRYLNKGSLVLVEGRIKTRNWVNPQGIKQYRTEIIADNLQLGPKTSTPDATAYEKAALTSDEPTTLKQNEIPVIEENYAPPLENNPENQKISFEDEAADEINVEDIPF